MGAVVSGRVHTAARFADVGVRQALREIDLGGHAVERFAGVARFRRIHHCASSPAGLLERLHFSMSLRFAPRDGAESEGARDEVQRKRLKPGHSCP